MSVGLVFPFTPSTLQIQRRRDSISEMEYDYEPNIEESQLTNEVSATEWSKLYEESDDGAGLLDGHCRVF